MSADSAAFATIDAVREFNRFYTGFLGVLNRAYLDTPYTLTEARVLFEIGARNGIAASTLTHDLHLDPAYLSRIMKRFRAEDLIESRADPSDLRSQIVTLTPAGRGRFDDFADRARAQIAARFEVLPQEASEQVVEAMRAIRAILDEETAAGSPAIIRAHRPGDMGWIVQSQARFYSAEYGWDSRFEALVADVAGRFLATFNPDRDYCWIAERGGLNVGSAIIMDGGDGIAKLRLLYVDKAARGLGLGKTLVDECIAFSKRTGYRELSLWTNDILATARNIYLKAGFRLVSEERHRMFGPELNGQMWTLDLSQ